MATIRDRATGQMFDGPDDAPVPEGFERVGATADTAKAPEEPGYVSRTLTRAGERAKETATFPLRVGRLVAGVDKPQGIEDVALLAMGNAPLIAASGGLAGLAHVPKLAPLARVAGAVGLAKGRGEDTTTALLEGAGAGMAEGAMALGGKVLGGPAKALEAIRDRIGRGQSGALNLQLLDKLVSWWRADPMAPVRAQRASVVAKSLEQLDPSRESSRLFLDAVAKGPRMPVTGRQLPPVSPGWSEVARAATGSTARAGADAAMSADPLAPAAALYGASQMPSSVLNLAKGMVR